MDLPCQFGDYHLLDRIAVGGMAEVYLAKAYGVEGFEKRVVIKRILPQLASSPRFVSMFVQEARISALLSHPNIVQVFDLGKVDGDYYIAMEYIHGRDLTRMQRRLRSSGQRMPLALAVHAAASIARALAYAHSRTSPDGQRLDIVHRDVSPHNVIVSFQGEVKLLDFGIARLAGDHGAERSGRPGGGKYAYMSPEQAAGAAIDGRSDIFSCGIVLYELLINKRLFQHEDPVEKLRMVREAIVPDPRPEHPWVPDALWEILQRALTRDPAARYARADDLEEDLRAFLYAAGLRANDADLGAFWRAVFADDLGPDPAASDLERLVQSIAHLDAEPDTEDSTLSQPGHTTTEGTLSTEGWAALIQREVGERKPVTAVVAEVVGFTELSELVEPEELMGQHRQLIRIIRRVAERYGGWLDRFADDTAIVLFGVPRTREDDHHRALACARELTRLRERLQRRGLNVELAVGVHRGEVAMSGRMEKISYLPRGDVLKLARRLATIAEPGQVIASEKVASQCGDRWRFRPGPRLRLKGQRAETPSFLLSGRRRHGNVGMAGRWCRRGDELERMGSALKRLAGGAGGRISLRGGAGVGKSRLVRELQSLARRARVPFYVGRAYPYSAEALAPFRELVAQVVGVEPNDDADRIREKMRRRLQSLKMPDAEIATIAGLFGLDGGRRGALGREASFAAAAGLVLGLARERPVVLALEDLHHQGEREREMTAHLLRATADQPLLWILTTREPWPDDLPLPDAIVRLGPLPPARQAQFVSDLLGVEVAGPSLLALIRRFTEGNPLYITEILKALQGDGRIRITGALAALNDPDDEPGIPPTLEGLIAARVDALDPGAKLALQLAATIGARFPAALLAGAAGLETVKPILVDLANRGLVVAEGRDGTWSFSSPLVWEVVRRSGLAAQTREHHLRISEGMERLYADRMEPHYDALALHCAAGGRMLDAARYVNLAGDQHRRGAFLDRALACFNQGVLWIGKAGDVPGRNLGEAMLNLKAGELFLLKGQLREAERHLQVALDIADESNLSDIEAGCFLALGRLYQARGQGMMARINLEQGLTQTELVGTVEEQVEFLEALGRLAQEEGDADQADGYFERTLALAEGNPDLQARALSGLANRAIRVGEEDRALELLSRARALADDAGDRILIGKILNNLGALQFSAGRYADSLRYFQEALDLRRDTGYRPGVVTNLYNTGLARFHMGDEARAYVAFERSRDAAREVGLAWGVSINEMYLGYLDAERGDAERGLATLRRAIHDSQRDADAVLAGRWLEGRHLTRAGQAEAGREILESALAEARARGTAWIVRDIEAELAG